VIKPVTDALTCQILEQQRDHSYQDWDQKGWSVSKQVFNDLFGGDEESEQIMRNAFEFMGIQYVAPPRDITCAELAFYRAALAEPLDFGLTTLKLHILAQQAVSQPPRLCTQTVCLLPDHNIELYVQPAAAFDEDFGCDGSRVFLASRPSDLPPDRCFSKHWIAHELVLRDFGGHDYILEGFDVHFHKWSRATKERSRNIQPAELAIAWGQERQTYWRPLELEAGQTLTNMSTLPRAIDDTSSAARNPRRQVLTIHYMTCTGHEGERVVRDMNLITPLIDAHGCGVQQD